MSYSNPKNTSGNIIILSSVGQSDISCNAYNDVIRGTPADQSVPTNFNLIPVPAGTARLRAILVINKNDYKRREGRFKNSLLPGNQNRAGAVFTPLFPSQCANCLDISGCSFSNNQNIKNTGYNQTLLAKKSYMFRQNMGNVTSGPITNNGRVDFNNAIKNGGQNGMGLSKNKMLSNAGKGFNVLGQPLTKRGVQTIISTNSNIFSSDPRLQVITNGRRQILPLCASNRV